MKSIDDSGNMVIKALAIEDGKLIDWETLIRDFVECCSCGKSMKDSPHINGICLDREATWEYPTWGNILVQDKYPEPRATAILCDRCVREGWEEKEMKVKFAIEWNEEEKKLIYHKVESLKVLPQISEKDIGGLRCPGCGHEIEKLKKVEKAEGYGEVS